MTEDLRAGVGQSTYAHAEGLHRVVAGRSGSRGGGRRCYGRRMSATDRTALKPTDLLDLDHLFSDEERQIRALAREWVRDRILPRVEDWYEQGEFPARELAKELGELGFLGMQLEGMGGLGDRRVRARGARARSGRLRAP